MMVLVFLLCFLPSLAGAAVTTDDCMGCHDNKKAVRHGSATCTDCHTDVRDLPHPDKLAKPACKTCHQDAEGGYAKSVHKAKGVRCSTCHDAHNAAKAPPSCRSCHSKAAHKNLPAPKKHLDGLPCTACHGVVQASNVSIVVESPRGSKLRRELIDLDGNNILDKAECDNLQALLQKQSPRRARITRHYIVKADPHAVTLKPATCQACHSDAPGLFKDARMTVAGDIPFELAVARRAVLPRLPDIEGYNKTPHGRAGVQCRECHISEKQVGDKVCAQCHDEAYTVYKHSVHAAKGATLCTDCHDPHGVKKYQELDVRERIAVCSRCHKDYTAKHAWLPHTALHFQHLECSTCHSPRSTKSMVFQLMSGRGAGAAPITYEHVKDIFGEKTSVQSLFDEDRDGTLDPRELGLLFEEVRKKGKDPLSIGASIVVTKAHHDYSETRQKERLCRSCHSDAAPFYDSMFLIVPGPNARVYIPVRGTLLSALPTSLAVDMVVLGEAKLRHEDVRRFLAAKGQERKNVIRELGFQWIDFFGLLLIGAVLAGVALHAIGRSVFRR